MDTTKTIGVQRGFRKMRFKHNSMDYLYGYFRFSSNDSLYME
jgi:hypothetical protein